MVYDDKRQKKEFSQECSKALQITKKVFYANMFTLFLVNNPNLIDQIIKKNAPNIQERLLRTEYEGKLITFSLSDKAINHNKSDILELSFFGSAVKILGAYESYVQDIVKISNQRIPEDMEKFRNKHTNEKVKFQNDKKRPDKNFIHPKLGRGLVFFNEVFGLNPDSPYKKTLNFFFELRNTAVHRMNIADENLVGASKSEFINVKGSLKKGSPVEWDLSLILQLIDLISSLLYEVDPKICSILNLTTVTEREYFYLNE